MPNQEGAVSQDPMGNGPQKVASKPEEIFDDSVNRQELLCLTGGFELSHLSFSLSGRLVGNFSSIITKDLGVVDDRRHD
jgi:hypothetical protein